MCSREVEGAVRFVCVRIAAPHTSSRRSSLAQSHRTTLTWPCPPHNCTLQSIARRLPARLTSSASHGCTTTAAGGSTLTSNPATFSASATSRLVRGYQPLPPPPPPPPPHHPNHHHHPHRPLLHPPLRPRPRRSFSSCVSPRTATFASCSSAARRTPCSSRRSGAKYTTFSRPRLVVGEYTAATSWCVLFLPVAPSVSRSCQHTRGSKIPPSPAVYYCLPVSPQCLQPV